MSPASLKLLFPRGSQCRRFPTLRGIEAESHRRRAVFLRADVRRASDVAVVEVGDAHALVLAIGLAVELGAVLLRAAIRVQAPVVEVVVEVVARAAGLVDRVPAVPP